MDPRDFEPDEDIDPEDIEARKVDLARRRAWLDQLEMKFDGLYHRTHPRVNQWRLDDLEALRFQLEIEEWEIEKMSEEST